MSAKLLESEGLHNVQLVQAYGQHIPCQSASLDRISALNVIEHVFDLDSVLDEVTRLLRPNGMFVGDSRNRYDLFFREPHVKLRWVGMLPRTWARRYVRWRLGTEYDHTLLFSWFDLRRAFNRRFPRRYRILFPGVAAYGGPPWFERLTSALERLPWLANLALLIFPSHLVLARQAGAGE